MKVAVLTSSRADYSIYLPLLKKMQSDAFFDLSIIAFGTHVSAVHGMTVEAIKNDGFTLAYSLKTFPETDSPQAISASMGDTMLQFSKIWQNTKYDLVLALGDRYEMFAACASGMPFNIKIAHIHGGEETLGAIDNAFRHAITHMASCHFTATEVYYKRVTELIGHEKNVFNVGSLSFDTLFNTTLMTIEEFKDKYHIDLSVPTILITFHPETVSYQKNQDYIHELIEALRRVKNYQLVITMPNADTMGDSIREKLNAFIANVDNAIGVESFGTIGYLTCMKYCCFMLGNTSSGFIEAAFFSKHVINLGDRQKGRFVTPNIKNVPINTVKILEAIDAFTGTPISMSNNLYGDGKAAEKILQTIKDIYG